MKLVKSVVWVALLVSAVLTGLSTVAIAQSGLTPEEEAGLLQMREEEKLARDVYTKMEALWGKRIFSNIMISEQTHMDAVKTLLDRYQLHDPAAGKDPGVFTNSDIQSLYNKLETEGSASLVAALGVGVTIEKMDIEDLNAFLEETARPDIKRVFENLLAGSENHLAAFEDQLK
jgi:hypothetical protein